MGDGGKLLRGMPHLTNVWAPPYRARISVQVVVPDSENSIAVPAPLLGASLLSSMLSTARLTRMMVPMSARHDLCWVGFLPKLSLKQSKNSFKRLYCTNN